MNHGNCDTKRLRVWWHTYIYLIWYNQITNFPIVPICFEWILCFRMYRIHSSCYSMPKFNRCVVLCDFILQTKCHIQFRRNNVSIVFIQSVWLDRCLVRESRSNGKRNTSTQVLFGFFVCQRTSHSIYAPNCQWPKKGHCFFLIGITLENVKLMLKFIYYDFIWLGFISKKHLGATMSTAEQCVTHQQWRRVLSTERMSLS